MVDSGYPKVASTGNDSVILPMTCVARPGFLYLHPLATEPATKNLAHEFNLDEMSSITHWQSSLQ